MIEVGGIYRAGVTLLLATSPYTLVGYERGTFFATAPPDDLVAVRDISVAHMILEWGITLQQLDQMTAEHLDLKGCRSSNRQYRTEGKGSADQEREAFRRLRTHRFHRP